MSDANRGKTGTGVGGAGAGTGVGDSIGLSGGSAGGASGLSDAGVGAAGGTTAVKSPPAKRASTKPAAAPGASVAGGSTSGGGAKAQLRDGASKVREKAGGKAREYALKGKEQATSKLDDVERMVRDAAAQVDEKLGPQYGGYARSAADAVAGFASTLRQKDVDELVDDARAFVRKSPAVAIGAAAAVGFVLARIVKSGIEPQGPNAAGDQGPSRPTTTL